MSIFNKFSSFLRKEDGITATEYALMIVFIALAIGVGAAVLGTDLSNFFGSVGGKV